MERRGLTLIEVLAAIAIMVVLTALALPTFESRLEGARFDAAVSGVEAAVVSARAEAQRRGIVVSLVARPVQGGTGLFIEGAPDPAQASAASKTPATASPRADAAPAGPTDASGVIAFNEASTGPVDSAPLGSPSVVVGDREKVTTQAPSVNGPGAATGAESVLAGSHGADSPAAVGFSNGAPTDSTPIIIARFLPDGTAVAAGPLYVIGKDKAAQITINRWMGSFAVKSIDLDAPPEETLSTETPPARGSAPASGHGATPETGL